MHSLIPRQSDISNIQKISYLDILPIWENELWSERKDPIEPTSCMKFNGGYESNQERKATYFAWIASGKIVGVNSGHSCEDGTYRSRGLWVHPDSRGQGIARELLFATIEQGVKENASIIWSFPRQSSWKTYKSVGFERSSEWNENLNNTNAYCFYDVKINQRT